MSTSTWTPTPLADTVALGPNLPRVRSVGVGTWQWGDRHVWRYGREFGEADVRGACEAALRCGLNLFDTAEIYGNGESERLLGGCLRAAGAETTLVATKFMPYPWRLGRGALPRALEGSLGRLRVSSVGLYQVHMPLPPLSVETWAEGLAEAVSLGLTRAVGVSNYSADQMRRTQAVLARRGVPLASNQVEFSLLQRRPERDGLLRTCQELGVQLVAYSPLAKGLLGGRYTRRRPPSLARRLSLPRGAWRRLPPLLALMRQIGLEQGGKTPAQVALNWLLCKGALPIPGARNASQVEENAGALGWRLTDAQLAALDRATGD